MTTQQYPKKNLEETTRDLIITRGKLKRMRQERDYNINVSCLRNSSAINALASTGNEEALRKYLDNDDNDVTIEVMVKTVIIGGIHHLDGYPLYGKKLDQAKEPVFRPIIRNVAHLDGNYTLNLNGKFRELSNGQVINSIIICN